MRSVRAAGVAAGVVVVALLAAAAVTLPLGTVGGRLGAGASPAAAPASARASSAAARVTAMPTAEAGVTAPSAPPTAIPETGIDVGQQAPDFELPTPEGATLRLSDLRGQPVWVNFWAPWCPACRTEMPRLEGFYLEHKDDGLVVLGVGVRDSIESLRAYAGEVGITYPIVVDGDGDGAVANAYRALALPVHYWIDRDGVVRDWAVGELPPDLLAASLQSILAASAP